jgi:hypothetical protein
MGIGAPPTGPPMGVMFAIPTLGFMIAGSIGGNLTGFIERKKTQKRKVSGEDGVTKFAL